MNIFDNDNLYSPYNGRKKNRINRITQLKSSLSNNFMSLCAPLSVPFSVSLCDPTYMVFHYILDHFTTCITGPFYQGPVREFGGGLCWQAEPCMSDSGRCFKVLLVSRVALVKLHHAGQTFTTVWRGRRRVSTTSDGMAHAVGRGDGSSFSRDSKCSV